MKKTKTEQNPQSVGQTFELDGNIYKGTYLEAKKIFNETFANADFEEIPPFEYWVENTDMFQIEKQVGHTPGEWFEIGGDSKSRYIHANKPNGDLGKIVATAHGENLEETKANARLIVSAVNNTAGKGINPEAVPDLMEALKKVYSEFEWTLSEEKSDSRRISIEKALTAINKATKQ